MSKPTLTIVVPVYNVKNYILKCLESIAAQSRNDFTVFVIDDGSTDGSAELCNEYCCQNKRFKYFRQENKGLGETRNVGIKMAETEWITFIDSDDWFSEFYVEKMMSLAERTDADIVYCDSIDVYEDGSTKYNAQRSFAQWMRLNPIERVENPTQCSVCGAVYKTNLWKKNEIIMPSIVFEDSAVFYVLTRCATTIETVYEGLYYYRAKRKGSLMDRGRTDVMNMIKALEHTCKLCDSKPLFVDISLERYISRKLSMERNYYLKSKGQEVSNQIIDAYKRFFPNSELECFGKMISVGGYISTLIDNHLSLVRDKSKNYEYSSIISMMTRPLSLEHITFHNGNMYRESMIKKDLNKQWKSYLSENSYLFFDLLEERNDIYEIDGTYITKSIAFDEECRINSQHRVIERDTEECWNLWENYIASFFKVLEQNNVQPIMNEMYLCLTYGRPGAFKEYEQIDEISKANRLLERYYEYIKKNYPDVRVISQSRDYMVTDTLTSFETEPWMYGTCLAGKIASELCRR